MDGGAEHDLREVAGWIWKMSRRSHCHRGNNASKMQVAALKRKVWSATKYLIPVKVE